MIAPNVPGLVVVRRWRERCARQIPAPNMTFSSPFLSSIRKQHQNRRGFCRFGLSGRFIAAHLKAKHRNEMATEIKE